VSQKPKQPTDRQQREARAAVDRLMAGQPTHVREDRARLAALALAAGHKIRLD
jgi:hypothetical protein